MDRKRILLAVLAAVASTLVVSAVSLYVFTWWMIRNHQIHFFNEQRAKSVLQVAEQAQSIGKTVIGSCVTREDLSSIGNKADEQRLEVVSQLLTLSGRKQDCLQKES